MPPARLPSSPIPSLRTLELTLDREPLLQRFFDANPAYFLAVQGELAAPNEAHDEIHDDPPAGWGFTKKWLVGYVDAEGSLAAVANVISDLLVANVWHIGLFIVATSRHGSGEAHAIYDGLEAWAVSNGARWLRLGVVQGNLRGERFWERLGYVQTRSRDGIVAGPRTNTVRVMVKPLAGGSLEEYLDLVPRDRPESP